MPELTGRTPTAAPGSSSALVELAVMKARGQLTDEEFEAAKFAILGKCGKTGYGAATPPDEKFVCTETTGKRGSAVGAAILVYFAGMILMFGSMPIIGGVGGIVIGGVATVYCLYLFFVGVRDAFREGPCPHCRSTVTLRNREETARSCGSCKHRIILRNGKLCDVTPA